MKGGWGRGGGAGAWDLKSSERKIQTKLGDGMIEGEEVRDRRWMEAITRACSTGNLLFVIHTGLGEHLEMGDRDLKVKPSPSSPEPLVTVIFPRILQSKRDSGENPHDTPWAFGLFVNGEVFLPLARRRRAVFHFLLWEHGGEGWEWESRGGCPVKPLTWSLCHLVYSWALGGEP